MKLHRSQNKLSEDCRAHHFDYGAQKLAGIEFKFDTLIQRVDGDGYVSELMDRSMDNNNNLLY